ncbi:peptidoglycan -binding protein [Methylobacterium sp. P31]
MASAAGRSRRALNVWPGYVDALATLLLSVVFLLTVFVVGQFFLSQELTGRDETLAKLNRQIADLTDLLALERSNRRNQEEEVRNLRTTLAAVEIERDQAKTQAEAATVSQGAAGTLDKQLEAERGATKRALSQIDLLNEQISAMRRQLAALEDALAASESRDRESQARIAELGSRLNVALAQKVQELARYRSDFFGRLRQILGNRPDIRVVGDRFVLQSEVLFPAGSAALKPEAGPEARPNRRCHLRPRQADPGRPALGAAGGRPHRRAADQHVAVPSNWALSAARAIAVVQYLAGKGIPPQHLLAGAFGEFQPLDPGTTEEAYARNRRIELKLTER